MKAGYYIIEKAGMEEGFETNGKYDFNKFSLDGPYETIEKADEILLNYKDSSKEMVSGYLYEDGTMMTLKEFYGKLISGNF